MLLKTIISVILKSRGAFDAIKAKNEPQKKAPCACPSRPGLYRHYKGPLYEVIGTAHHSENLEYLVVYRALYHCPEYGRNALWVRPVSMFLQKVRVGGVWQPRFQHV